MSRGPGKWQRAVLEACEGAIDPETGFSQSINVDAVHAHATGSTLSPDDRSTREAIRRAVRTLAEAGRVEVWHRSERRPKRRNPSWVSDRYTMAVRLTPSHEQMVAEAEDQLAKQRHGLERARTGGSFMPEEHWLAKVQAAEARLAELHSISVDLGGARRPASTLSDR